MSPPIYRTIVGHNIIMEAVIDIQIDPRNKSAEYFFIFLKIQDGRRAGNSQKWNLDKISAQKSQFSLANVSRSSDLDKITQEHTT